MRKSQLKSLDFAVNSALRKIFDTKSQYIVEECRKIFNCLSCTVGECFQNSWIRVTPNADDFQNVMSSSLSTAAVELS